MTGLEVPLVALTIYTLKGRGSWVNPAPPLFLVLGKAPTAPKGPSPDGKVRHRQTSSSLAVLTAIAAVKDKVGNRISFQTYQSRQGMAMAFNKEIKKKIVQQDSGQPRPCVMCGRSYPLPDAVHIIDENEWKEEVGEDRQSNGIPLCPNCHRIFDEELRPHLFRALKEFGSEHIPKCWKKSNKLSGIQGRIHLD
jgi:HNH endonuclease